MAPIVDGLEAQYRGKVSVRRINTDTEPGIARQYNVQTLPTFIFLDSTGTQIERQDGGNPEALRQGFEKAAGK